MKFHVNVFCFLDEFGSMTSPFLNEDRAADFDPGRMEGTCHYTFRQILQVLRRSLSERSLICFSIITQDSCLFAPWRGSFLKCETWIRALLNGLRLELSNVSHCAHAIQSLLELLCTYEYQALLVACNGRLSSDVPMNSCCLVDRVRHGKAYGSIFVSLNRKWGRLNLRKYGHCEYIHMVIASKFRDRVFVQMAGQFHVSDDENRETILSDAIHR
jgi:hypothetical protein